MLFVKKNMKKQSFTGIKNFFTRFERLATKKGSVVGLSLTMTSGIFLMAAGSAAFVVNTNQANSKIEQSNVAYFAAERGMEYSLYDISGHLPGYEVDQNSDYGNMRLKTSATRTSVGINSRTYKSSSAENNQLEELSIPIQGKGDSSLRIEGVDPSENWNELRHGGVVTVPLFLDNTSDSNTTP